MTDLLAGRTGHAELLSVNQGTAQHTSMPEFIAGCAEAGLTHVGPWREPVAEYGVARSAAHLRAAGLSVSTLCRSGFFERIGWYDDNRRAIDEAAELGAPVLVIVSGGLPPGGRDLAGARRHVADAIAALAPYAAQAGVTLAIEALHPMFAQDRCVISTLAQALDIAEQHPVGVVGVVVDTYHLWWDDQVLAQIGRAGARVASFQLADWTTPLPEGALTGRVLPGEGCIDFSPLWTAVAGTGYRQPTEIEVFNTELWRLPLAQILGRTVAAWQRVRAGVHRE